MARSVLRMSRLDKHQRLFELIRQDNLASQTRARISVKPSPQQMQALRDRAEQSLKP